MADRCRLAAIMTCLVALSSLAGTACTQAAKQPCPTNSGPSRVGLCIDTVTWTVTGDQELAVHATIASASGVPLAGRVWWVLAPLGPGQPWERGVFLSRIENKKYSPHENVSLNWDSALALPAGLYDLALIVHRVNADGSETHADSRDVGPLRIGRAPDKQPLLIRHLERPGPAVVTSVSGPQSDQSGINPLSRTITIRNQGTSNHPFSARLEARTLPPGLEDRWWLGVALYTTKSVAGSVLPDQSQTVLINGSAPSGLLAAFPNAQFWVVVTAESASDEVLLGGPDTLLSAAPSGYLRRAQPAGPIELAGIADTSQWDRTARHRVTVTVRNLTGNAQVVKVFWYLAKPDDQQPWTDAAAGSVPFETTVGPWATEAVALDAYRPAPAGQWALSAWVHYREGPGAFVHSDGLWLAQPVTVI